MEPAPVRVVLFELHLHDRNQAEGIRTVAAPRRPWSESQPCCPAL